MAKQEGLSALGAFGEGFIKTLQYEREQKRKEQEFNQEMSYRIRQQNLMSKYYDDQIKARQEADFVNVQEGDVYNKMGVPSGRYHTSLLDNVIGAYNKTETTRNTLEGSYKNPSTGTYWKYDTDKKQGVDTLIPYDKSEGKTTEKKEPKNPTLDAEWKVEGYSNIMNPPIREDLKGNLLPDADNNYYSSEEVKEYLDTNMNKVATQLLKPKTLNFFNKLVQQYGRYPSPKELRDETLQSYSDDEAVLTDIENFLDHYEQLSSGIKKLERHSTFRKKK